MNILTYASFCSVSPRRMSLSLYKDTLSREFFMKKKSGVLQVLIKEQAELFQLLGKTSGRHCDKIKSIESMGYNVKQWGSELVMNESAGYLSLEAMSDFIPCGDHDVVICDVKAYANRLGEDRADQILHTADLRSLGLIN